MLELWQKEARDFQSRMAKNITSDMKMSRAKYFGHQEAAR